MIESAYSPSSSSGLTRGSSSSAICAEGSVRIEAAPHVTLDPRVKPEDDENCGPEDDEVGYL